MKVTFYHGLTAGFFTAAACLVYNSVYTGAFATDFSSLINSVGIIGASFFSCLLASVGYYFFAKFVQRQTDVWFNILFLSISFASFVPLFAINLPLELSMPELFIGLTAPMHLFPALFWLATKPLFRA